MKESDVMSHITNILFSSKLTYTTKKLVFVTGRPSSQV